MHENQEGLKRTMKKKERSFGQELVSRLERFTEKLDEAKSQKDLGNLVTVRKVKLNLQPQPYTSAEIKEIRKDQLQLSQAVFAQFLGVSVGTYRDWEQGRSDVIGPVCRILDEIRRDLSGWSARIRELGEVTTAG